MLFDDDGNELNDYRTSIYHRDVVRQYIKDAEKSLGSLMYDIRNFRKDFPENSVGVHFEGLTDEEAETLDLLEQTIMHHGLPIPIGLRW